MRNLQILAIALTIAGACSISSAAEFAEDFESYASGSALHGQGGWKGWNNAAGAGAPASSSYAFSGTNSVEIIGAADLVHEFDIMGGRWELTAMQYIPSGTTGVSWFILLNTYSDNGTQDWSVQTQFNLGTGAITSDYDGSASADIVYDQWVEFKCVIDLDNNTVDEYYNGEFFATHQWDDGQKNTLQVIDLYGNGASSIYYDDIVVAAPPEAYNPEPADGALHAAMWATLKWQPGDGAASHDVYLSTSFDEVNDRLADAFRGNQTAISLVVGFAGFAFPDGLVPGTTYYWRIDEIGADGAMTHAGDIWSFMVPPRTAFRAVPADGAKFVGTDATLSWTGGLDAKLHTVYFGDSFDDVNNAPAGIPQAVTTYDPGPLAQGTVYYWRVDEFDGVAAHKGNVWSFTTLPEIPVADDSNLVLWWTLDEGQGAVGPADWSGHDEHATLVDNPQWIVDGYERGALQFDGAEDYLYRRLAPAMPSQTVCVWARVDKAPASILGWSNAHPTSGTHDREFYVNADGTAAWRVWTSANNIVTSLGTIADGRWHHLAGVYTDEGTTELYLDGVLQGSNTASGIYNSYTSPFLTVGIDSHQSRYLTGAVDDLRVYDKALSAEEIGLVMLGDTELAGSPVPDRVALVDFRDISSLSWSRGDTAASHDVYFGTDRDAVAGADNSAPEFQGNQAGTSLSLADLVEFGGGDYYWRIDEVEADGTVIVGTLWQFTVPGYLIVDNFESYDDIDPAPGEAGVNRIFDKWIDGFETLNNGAVVGNDLPPYAETSIVHGGAQSMIYRYDNASKTSEATLTVAKRDWTAEGVTKLALWFRGSPANSAERMFVAVGNAVVYHDDPAATQISAWTEWVIDLQEFADQGVVLTDVSTITIGFGTRNSPAAGGTGTMHIDDIGLERPGQ